MIREGQSLALPDLAPVFADELRGLNREGGRITITNTAGLENASAEGMAGSAAPAGAWPGASKLSSSARCGRSAVLPKAMDMDGSLELLRRLEA